jgi:uncharacterized protein
MSLAMSEVTLVPIQRMLNNLSSILSKAEQHCDAKKIEHSALLQARLYPDMFALPRQVQICTDVIKGAVARLAGVDIPKYDDTEVSFADLRARIAKTLAFVNSVPLSQLDGTQDKTISVPRRDSAMQIQGDDYVLKFVLPNIYFHVATAYAILRHNGVEIGKGDFLGALP